MKYGEYASFYSAFMVVCGHRTSAWAKFVKSNAVRNGHETLKLETETETLALLAQTRLKQDVGTSETRLRRDVDTFWDVTEMLKYTHVG